MPNPRIWRDESGGAAWSLLHELRLGGAFSTAEAGRPLAAALGDVGLQGVTYDRRGRSASGDTPPYAPEREVEDLLAVIGAVGDPPSSATPPGRCWRCSSSALACR